ncbi:hypothetical protein [Sporolactobacillus terrae]|uniref:hypothetical protein n=1 Tax=Sporolactobacillus terrae TaxID=269673 RepID=UPI00048C2564|nr:hypothetical protein [Sporolactobacillus terrae]
MRSRELKIDMQDLSVTKKMEQGKEGVLGRNGLPDGIVLIKFVRKEYLGDVFSGVLYVLYMVLNEHFIELEKKQLEKGGGDKYEGSCIASINPKRQMLAIEMDGKFIRLPFTKAFHPKDKPNVEGTVKIISTWIIAALRNGQYFSIQLNEAIKEKLVEYNQKPFQKKNGSTQSAFAEEVNFALLPHTS